MRAHHHDVLLHVYILLRRGTPFTARRHFRYTSASFSAQDDQDGITHAVSASVSHATPELITWPLQHCDPPPGAWPHPPPPHWPQAAGQHACPFEMPRKHQPRNGTRGGDGDGGRGGGSGAGMTGGDGGGEGGDGGGELGTTHTVSASLSHGGAVLITLPLQHCSAPPGAPPHPPPPHWPQASAQQAWPFWMPSAHQPRKGGDTGGAGGAGSVAGGGDGSS
jgi:hypothetical protein